VDQGQGSQQSDAGLCPQPRHALVGCGLLSQPLIETLDAAVELLNE
jgi:hypothetical protein